MRYLCLTIIVLAFIAGLAEGQIFRRTICQPNVVYRGGGFGEVDQRQLSEMMLRLYVLRELNAKLDSIKEDTAYIRGRIDDNDIVDPVGVDRIGVDRIRERVVPIYIPDGGVRSLPGIQNIPGNVPGVQWIPTRRPRTVLAPVRP